jgi:AhpD family alkylhydroperoxidase
MSLRLAYWTVAPDAVAAMRGVSKYMLECGLDRNLVDLVYLRISQINGCAYCCDLHANDLRKAGESEQRLDCLAAWREASFFSARERAALAWAESLTHVSVTHAPDDAYQAARAEFSDKELVDLTFAVALMNAWNRIAVGFGQGPAERKAKAAAC